MRVDHAAAVLHGGTVGRDDPLIGAGYEVRSQSLHIRVQVDEADVRHPVGRPDRHDLSLRFRGMGLLLVGNHTIGTGAGAVEDFRQPERTRGEPLPAPHAADHHRVQSENVLDRAGDLLSNGQAGQAATLLAPVVGAEPGNGVAWLLMARARMALGAHAEALEAARTALNLHPHGIEELFWVSAAYTALGRHDLAVTAAAAASHEEPGHPRLAERHGRALLAAARTTEAVLVLEAAAEIAHYDADVQVTYGMALFAVGRPLSAREAYARALRLSPGHPRALTELRRLGAAERHIRDADSLVRVADEFAESLRIPAGGLHGASGPPVLQHVARVAFGVCLAALLLLAVLIRVAGVDVPAPLLIGTFTITGATAFLTAYTQLRR